LSYGTAQGITLVAIAHDPRFERETQGEVTNISFSHFNVMFPLMYMGFKFLFSLAVMPHVGNVVATAGVQLPRERRT
jgi:hypothetical protein